MKSINISEFLFWIYCDLLSDYTYFSLCPGIGFLNYIRDSFFNSKSDGMSLGPMTLLKFARQTCFHLLNFLGIVTPYFLH